MTIDDAFLAFIRSQTALTSVVADRIKTNSIPEDYPLPAVVVALQSSERAEHLSGASGLVRADFVVRIFSEFYDESFQLGDELRKVANGYSGAMGTMHCFACRLRADESLVEYADDYSTIHTYIRQHTYRIACRESL